MAVDALAASQLSSGVQSGQIWPGGAGQGHRPSRQQGVLRLGVRWLQGSPAGRALRVASAGLLLFEAGRQLGRLAASL
jgi:hypothetical protein